jgi:hypothetical protein
MLHGTEGAAGTSDLHSPLPTKFEVAPCARSFVVSSGILEYSSSGIRAAAATTLLFGVSTTDPTTYVAVSAGLAAVVVVAAYLPSPLATRVDPAVTWRQQSKESQDIGVFIESTRCQIKQGLDKRAQSLGLILTSSK